MGTVIRAGHDTQRVYDEDMTNTTPAPTTAVQSLRISRLLRGAREDLAIAERAQAAGWTGDINGSIADQIVKLRGHVAMWEGKLAVLGGAS
jgi:hypothetical protein